MLSISATVTKRSFRGVDSLTAVSSMFMNAPVIDSPESTKSVSRSPGANSVEAWTKRLPPSTRRE